MANENREGLRTAFTAGRIPKQSDFHEFINQALNQADDGIAKEGFDEPLKITAAVKMREDGSGVEDPTQKVLQLFKLEATGEREEKPSWQLNLASREAADADKADLTGLNIINPDIGVSRLYIDQQNGRVGIGTTQPRAKLTVVREGSEEGVVIVSKTAGNTHFPHTDDWNYISGEGVRFRFYDESDNSYRNKVTINLRSGNVGVGVSDPTAKLHVGGNLFLNLGEGLEFNYDENYWGAHQDARIIRIWDVNSTKGIVDGGFVIEGYTKPDNARKPLLAIKGTGEMIIPGQIMQEDWIELKPQQLKNNFANFGHDFATAAFYKDKQGLVHLRGFIKGGTDKLIFQLPAGYRPSMRHSFSTVNYWEFARVDVASNGYVTVETPDFHSNWLSLDGIAFRAA